MLNRFSRMTMPCWVADIAGLRALEFRRGAVTTLACFLLTLVSSPLSWAQPSCQLPATIKAPEVRPIDWSNPDVSTDYLSLVLSWSPEHCAQQTTSAQRAKHAFQCELNSFEFVVHGLWPQSAQAHSAQDHPRNCKDAQALPVDLLKRHLCTVPGTDLMQNEWQAHGTCGWPDPETYFGTIERLVSQFNRPGFAAMTGAAAGTSTANTTSGRIKNAFVDANPGRLRRDQVQVTVGSGNRLKEIWICLTSGANPVPMACPPGGTPDDKNVIVRAPARPTAPPLADISDPSDSGDVECPVRQQKFSGYSSAAKSALWSTVYADGGKTIYCQAQFDAGSRQTHGGLPMNIEHALPKSKVKVTSGQGDLHNLWPSIVAVNSARANFALTGNIPGEQWTFASSPKPELANCDFEIESVKKPGGKLTVVEPTPQARGRLARSVLHMALAYRVPIPESEWVMYLDWHEQFPPAADEQRRNDRIASVQGTRNPFIDSPQHARLLVQSCRP